TTTITHSNKRKQQLKATRAKKKLHVSLDYEDLVWSDQDIDNRASDYFSVLLTASKNWKPSSRPSTYVGELYASIEVVSIEMELIEVELVDVELVESVESVEVESVEMELVEVNEKTKMRLAIKELDRMLKKYDNKIDNGIRVHLQASLQYLRLRYQGQTRISAGTMIASSLGWEDYKVQCIGAWTQNWIKWQKLPKENCGKFMKVSSLLDDERISIK
ncbi:16003_t:CDS:2, partial [Gigaspora margarita]